MTENGTIVFNQTFEVFSASIYDIAVSPEGIYLCGTTYDEMLEHEIASLIKLNKNNGAIEWYKNSTTQLSYLMRMSIIGNEIFTVGFNFSGNRDLYIIKWSLTGDTTGLHTFEAPQNVNSSFWIYGLEIHADTLGFFISFHYLYHSPSQAFEYPYVLSFNTNLGLRWGIMLNVTTYNQTETYGFAGNDSHLFVYGRAWNDTEKPNFIASIRKSDHLVEYIYLDEDFEDFHFLNAFVNGQDFYQLITEGVPRIANYWTINGSGKNNYLIDESETAEAKFMIASDAAIFLIMSEIQDNLDYTYRETFIFGKTNITLSDPPAQSQNPPSQEEQNPPSQEDSDPNPSQNVPEIFIGVAVVGSMIGIGGGQLINPKNIQKLKESIKKQKNKRIEDPNLEQGTDLVDVNISEQFEQPLDNLNMESELDALQTGGEMGAAVSAEQQNLITMLINYWNAIPKELKELIEKLASKYSKFVKQETFRRLIAFESISTDFLTANKLLALSNFDPALEKLIAAELNAQKERFIPIAEEARITKLELQKGGNTP